MSEDVTQARAGAVVGVVIAGGRSVRFGGEKALAQFRGEPLLTWAIRRLARSCSVVSVNARTGTQTEALARATGVPILYDAPGDAAGPLAGVKAGLAWARAVGARAVAVSPCDAPLLPEDLFQRLIDAAGAGAAMAETDDGPQPLCALWPTSAEAAVVEALAGGAHPSTWRLLDRIGAVRVRFASAQAFANVNTPSDLAAIADPP